MRRRRFLLGLGALGAATTLALKPGDRGAPYSAEFAALNRELQARGPQRPAMLIDLDRLDRNIDALKATLKPGATYRLVEKSLPCLQLIDYIQQRTGSHALMSFHLPFLQQDARRFADADILLGKPLPAAAFADFYRQGPYGRFDPSRQLTWLIDSEARLREYLQVARSLGVRLRLALEIDVGLHRGGFAEPAELGGVLALLSQEAAHLQLVGLMGYDAHIGKIPAVLQSRDESYRRACARYQGFVDVLMGAHRALLPERPLFNGAGSPTLALHREGSPCNDLSAGSCLLKPGDFDVPTLSAFQPAAFIATPVLKRLDQVQVPGIEALEPLLSSWQPNAEVGYFIYGGNWLAEPWAPQGVQRHSLYGHSSNQELYTGSRRVGLQVNDQLFLRPRQSEALLLQFGDLLAVRDGKLMAQWPVLGEQQRPKLSP
jgi:D-serine deaminase-like pyridoxal phosphate-dependent protein